MHSFQQVLKDFSRSKCQNQGVSSALSSEFLGQELSKEFKECYQPCVMYGFLYAKMHWNHEENEST